MPPLYYFIDDMCQSQPIRLLGANCAIAMAAVRRLDAGEPMMLLYVR
jgi:hypothetical protein